MVPVLDKNKKSLMPCTEKRARKLLEKRRAKPYWCKGIFCIILQDYTKTTYKQDVCIGIDPGSKFNGYSIKSEAHTFLKLQVKSVDTVKNKIEERFMLRRGRRYRKSPYRKHRINRSIKNKLPPSTKSRWQQHLNIIKWMQKLYNINLVALEDIKARTIKNARKWNKQFSPLEVGKHWFSEQVKNLSLKLYKYQGFETYRMRQEYGFKKNTDKSKKNFYTHAMDAWCLANEVIGGHTNIDNERTLYLKPLMFHRRKLHEILPKKNGFRRNYGGTMSLGLKRGTLVDHPKYRLSYIGGTNGKRISLHNSNTGKRLCHNSKINDIKILTRIIYLKELSHE